MRGRSKLTRAELARRTEQRRRTRLGLCWNCGGSRFVEATDNHGQRYMGCANCVIVVPEALRKAGAR